MYAKAVDLSPMKNFKYVSQHDFLSVPEANMAYHNMHYSQKAQTVLVFHVRKMLR
jgi:hypothetical protein